MLNDEHFKKFKNFNLATLALPELLFSCSLQFYLVVVDIE